MIDLSNAHEVHQAVRELSAQYLQANPHRLRITTSVLELCQWSHARLVADGKDSTADPHHRALDMLLAQYLSGRSLRDMPLPSKTSVQDLMVFSHSRLGPKSHDDVALMIGQAQALRSSGDDPRGAK
jgi:hypothetical protein